MSERLRESLSALMDDAADDLELARVLRAMNEDDEVSDTWSCYHLVSAVLRGGDVRGFETSGIVAIDVEAEALAAGMAGPADAAPAAAHGERKIPSWMSFAAAATITLAVVVGFQWPDAESEAPAFAAAPAQDAGPVRIAPRSVRAVSEGRGAAQSLPEVRRVPLSFRRVSYGETGGLPPASEAELQVDAYMLHHAEYAAASSVAGMMSFARYAAFEDRH